MTIFQLLVYSCVAANGLDGEPLPKACGWEPHDLYATRGKCNEAGAGEYMKRMFAGVEKHRCARVMVN